MRGRFPMRAPAAIALTLLVGCGAATGSSPPGTAAPTTSTAPIETANAFQVEDTRRLLEQHLRAIRRQGAEAPDLIEFLDSPYNADPADDDRSLTRLGEELADWIAEERAWVAAARSGACVAPALDAYGQALEALEIVSERLLAAEGTSGAAKERALAATEDLEDAIDRAEEMLPEDCAP